MEKDINIFTEEVTYEKKERYYQKSEPNIHPVNINNGTIIYFVWKKFWCFIRYCKYPCCDNDYVSIEFI